MTLALAQRQKLKQFHEDGLVWLINTAVLHPRGLALQIGYPDADDGDEHPDLPVWLAVTGDGNEPWCFGSKLEDLGAEVVERYIAAEARREATWSALLDRGGSS